MEMVLSNGFCEMSQDEVMDIDGGLEWYDHVGNFGAMACGVGVLALGATPIGMAATAACILWGLHF